MKILAGVVALLDDEFGWRARAACRGSGINFFRSGAPDPRARQLCAGCPVADQCRDYADEVGIDVGIFGGMTGPERRRNATTAAVRPPGAPQTA